MAPSAYQVLASIATPGTVDSHHQTKAKEMFTPKLEANLNAFTAARPKSPCFTAGSTSAPLAQRMAASLVENDHPA